MKEKKKMIIKKKMKNPIMMIIKNIKIMEKFGQKKMTNI